MGVLTSAFVIAGCSSVPLMYNNYNKHRLDALYEFLELYRDVLQEINHLLTPVPEALAVSKKNRSEPVRKTVEDFLYGLSKSHAVSFSEVWTAAIYYNKASLNLNDKECAVLCKFGEYIDSHKSVNKYGIEESLKIVIERLEELIEQTKSQHERYAPMYNKLGLLLGVGLSLFTI